MSEKKNITVHLPVAVIENLNGVARSLGVSRSVLIASAFSKGVFTRGIRKQVVLAESTLTNLQRLERLSESGVAVPIIRRLVKRSRSRFQKIRKGKT